jgi:DNA anti-recombination protein RmuC
MSDESAALSKLSDEVSRLGNKLGNKIETILIEVSSMRTVLRNYEQLPEKVQELGSRVQRLEDARIDTVAAEHKIPEIDQRLQRIENAKSQGASILSLFTATSGWLVAVILGIVEIFKYLR